MLDHGGAIIEASSKFSIPPENWLDLSTGISPFSYPIPDIPLDVWRRLPQAADGLHEAAGQYYGTTNLLAVAGSQAAIQVLPRLRPPCRAGFIWPSYAEHRHAWAINEHEVGTVTAEQLESDCRKFDVVTICNPNNPTGKLLEPERLLDCAKELARRGGWLIVDEAFMDATPEASLAQHAGLPGLIVLRSLGKFFGLAGARVGFLCARAELLDKASELLGPWTIGGPSRYAATHALSDYRWQQDMRQKLKHNSMKLAGLLAQCGLPSRGSTAFFHWILLDQAAALHDSLCRQGVLTRLFLEPPSIRFGLPAEDHQFARLGQSLKAVVSKSPS